MEKNIRDRAPEIKAAGKLIPRGSGAKDCLVMNSSGSPKTPDLVKQFRSMTRPEPGEARLSHSAGSLDKNIRHGVKTKSSLAAEDLMSPPRKTKFEQVCLDQKETIYNSKQKAPLGSSHNQSPGLPSGMNPILTVFGLKNIKDASAGDMVSPQKTATQVDQEYNTGRELYKKSHNDWGVGEMVDRNYDWSKYTKGSLYGVPTPHDNSGSGANSSLNWRGDSGSAEIVSKRLDNFRERTQPQLGQVHDPIAETLNVDDDHTFGTSVKADESNAGSLMHMEGPTTYQQTETFDSGVLSSLRIRLKKNNFHNFDGFLEALQFKDKNKSGKISGADVCEVCFLFNIPLTPEMLDMLIRWCTQNSAVVYSDLVTLINWKSEPAQDVLERVAANTPVTNGSPVLMSNYCTSSQMIKAAVGEVKLSASKPHGVPTIRSDLPAPRIKRVADLTNYGDESDAYGLMYPSIYSNKGVYEKDFFQPRDKVTIRAVFEKIGVSMSDEVFQTLWAEAERRGSRGQVSVESFRALMEEMQADQVQQQDTHNESTLSVA